MFSDILYRLRALFRRQSMEDEMHQELGEHFDRQVEKLVASGLSRAEALRRARLDFGALDQVKEECRDERGVSFIEVTLQDIRYALRMLRKNRGFAATAILVLALGICASAAIFAFVDAALIKPLPYANPTRLMEVTEGNAMFPRANLSYPDYLDWKKLNKVFASVDVTTGTGFLLGTPQGMKPVLAARVSDGFFRTLGVSPALGRDFYPGEDRADASTVILSYAAWQQFFGGRREVVGQPVTLSGLPFTVVGVLPREFQFAPRGDAAMWVTIDPSDHCAQNRACHNLNGVARLKDGVAVETALADMKSISAQLEKEYPGSNRGQGAVVLPLAESIVGDIRPMLLVLLSGAALLLLIACVNVTSLLLARSESRKREIAVRGALGASRGRLIRQFATEGLVLVSAGGALGVISSAWAMHFLIKLIPADTIGYLPYLQGLGLNSHSIAFAGAVSLVAAMMFTATPALHLSLADPQAGLAEGGRGGILWRRFGSNFVVAELAIAMVLLVGAGLLGKSFYRLLHVDLRFEPNHLATVSVTLPRVGYEKDEQMVAVGREMVNRISSLPGVKSVALASQFPVSFNGNTDWIRFVGKPYNGEHNEVNQRDVSSAYFTTLQAKLLRGRFLTDAEDGTKPKVVIINQALAAKYFPGEDPIGKKIGDDGLTTKSIRQIVGIVDDIREGSLDSDIWPTEYLPINQSTDASFGVIVRSAQAEDSLLPAIDAVVRKIDPNIGTASEMSLRTRINNSATACLHRSSAWLVGGFAALALLLGVVGLYGVIAYSVSQRTREIGVRMALGAERRSVYHLILRDAAWLAGLGVGIGLICSVAAATLMGKLLFGTAAWDVPTLAGVAALLAVCALVASYIPARRATQVDPMIALRCE